MTQEPRIVNRGDGPKIEGTRITVYTVYEYIRSGRSRDWIAATLGLSSRQVEAAVQYIEQDEINVRHEYDKILARIAKGNPPWTEARRQQSREKLKALQERLRSAKIGAPAYAEGDVGL